MTKEQEIQDIIDGNYVLKVGDSFIIGNSKKQHKVISETNKYLILNTCFEGYSTGIKIRKKDGLVMGGILYGQRYINLTGVK